MPLKLDKKLMIGGGLLLLLIIVIIVVVMMTKKKSPSSSSSSSSSSSKNTYLSFLYKGNTYYLVLNNGSPVSVTTNITNATPVVLVPKVLPAGVLPAQNVFAIQTTSGKFVNLTYSASQNVINANENMVSISDTFYYNSSTTFATLIINSANAIQTFFLENNLNVTDYWYIAYFNGSSFVFDRPGAGYVVIKAVTQ